MTEWFNTVKKSRRKIYMEGLKKGLLDWSDTKENGYKIDMPDLLKLMKPKYEKSYLDYLKKSSTVKKPRKGAFTGPASAHTKAKFEGRAVGISIVIGKILKSNGWVQKKKEFEKIHQRKERR